MNRTLPFILIALSFTINATFAQQAKLPYTETQIEQYASLKYEIARAIERGNDYLKSKQSDGIWGSKAFPAISALAVTAYMRSPEATAESELPAYIQQSYDFILSSQKENGAIFNKGLASYNTSVCMMALMAADRKDYLPALLNARAFLVKQQNHFAPDNPYNGGIGYGDETSPPIADLSNTSLALEALYYSKKLAEDASLGKQPELDWGAAIDFISRCQVTSENSGNDRGGFRYKPSDIRQSGSIPEHKKQGAEPGGAYGSMTYAGILSLIYADVQQDDPRVQMAREWLASNYTLEENPGVGLQGLYYYYQAMAKTMTASRMDRLELKNGQQIDWRGELAKKLITTQASDGSWVNTNNRWWESDPVLVTAYCVLALEQVYYTIPAPKKNQ